MWACGRARPPDSRAGVGRPPPGQASWRPPGGAGANILDGFEGNDSLVGGAGDDTLIGGAGADILEGGTGTDIALYDYAGSASIGQNFGSFGWSIGSGGSDTLRDMEFARFTNGTLNLTTGAFVQTSFAITPLQASRSEGDLGASPFTFTVTRSGDTALATSVAWAVTGSGTNPADAEDFEGSALPAGVVSFAAGETSRTITVNVRGDTTLETDEGFKVTLTSNGATGLITGTPAQATILSEDLPDPDPVLSIAPVAAALAEGQAGSTSFTFTVTRSGNTSGASSAAWTVSGNAADAADFVGNAFPSGTVSFAAGETSQSITIEVAGDTGFEADEGFTVTLSGAVGASLAPGAAAAQATIGNDDAVLNIAATPVALEEGTGTGANFSFTVTRGGDATGVASATWAVAGDGATASDFAGNLLPSGTVSFAAGETSQTITFTTAGDTSYEADEGFTVTLSDAVGASLGTATASGTIRNDDLPGILGTSGANSLPGTNGQDVISGEGGNDRLSGLGGNDWLLGGSGLDTLDGGQGADRMEGGDEDDTYVVDHAGDTTVELGGGGNDLVKASVSWTLAAETERMLLIGTGNLDGTGNGLANRLDGNVGINRLDGDAGNDTLAGNAGQDHLLGGSGDDLLVGGTGADSMEGGAGNDIYVADQAGDVVLELAGGGDDQVQAAVSWTLGAEFERLLLLGSGNLTGTGNGLSNLIQGNAGANRLEGGAGDDTMGGGAGQDTLVGGDGKDRLSGGLGADRLEGGLHADRFIFISSLDADGDVIADFSAAQGDRIDLRRMDTNAALAGDQAFAWIGGASFSNQAGQLRYAGGVLAGDLDGNGVADFQVTFENAALLTAANIWL
ncbi:MAG: hypothetical protein K5Q68_10660 [Roseococcus sp.]|nr:hypothetical protein [Roseococcus sp.]